MNEVDYLISVRYLCNKHNTWLLGCMKFSLRVFNSISHELNKRREIPHPRALLHCSPHITLTHLHNRRISSADRDKVEGQRTYIHQFYEQTNLYSLQKQYYTHHTNVLNHTLGKIYSSCSILHNNLTIIS